MEVQLLDVDPGVATHRTVFTFIGPPDAVVEAAFQAIRVAGERIDMREPTRGEHARIGATDVCPFVPVAGVEHGRTASELARRLGRAGGQRAGHPGVPVRPRGEPARAREPRGGERAGEYEGLRGSAGRPVRGSA